MTIVTFHIRSLLLAFAWVSVVGAAGAATLTFSSIAPTGGTASISNWTGATFDADNIGGTGVNSNGSPNNGSANDGTTYVANNRPAQGQTFTTGSNADGYTLSAITVRMQGYTSNTASGSNIGYYDLDDTSSIFRLRVGRVDGTIFVPLTQETAASGGSGNPGQSSSANGPGTYLTFTLKAPIVLAPNTTYAFDLGTSADYFEWLGIRDGASGGNPYTSGTAYTTGTSGVANGIVTTQAGDRVFMVDLTAYTAPAPGAFVHPGLLNTEADFDRMRTRVATGTAPWAAAYHALTTNWTGNSLGWSPNPQSVVYRGNDGTHAENFQILANDVAVAYGSALRWKISGDTAYADQAIAICNAWSSTLTSLGGDGNIVLINISAYQFAAVGEIMRTYSGWSATDFAAFKVMMTNVFAPLASDFITAHWGSWSSWDLANMDTLYAIGVLCDDVTLTDQALDYFYGGAGVGDVERVVNYIHPGYLGQTQEAGRDQGHDTLEPVFLGSLCEMAWNQGVDLYGYDNNRVLAAAEYVAKYNLGYDVPFAPFAGSDHTLMTTASSAARGLLRPGWDLLYNHYVNRKGLAAPYTKAAADQIRPSGYYNLDQPGFDTLTASLDPIAAGANPSGLTATVTAGQPVLSWWGSAYATSYNIKRSTTVDGSYTILATGVTTNTYTDTTAEAGHTYYYVVSATTPTGESGNSNEASAKVGTYLVARLKFDETSGTIAADSTGDGWDAALLNSPSRTTGKIGSALSLSAASSQYVSLPASVVSDLSDFTISTWVNLNSISSWARIFDFGTGTEKYLFLTPKDGAGVVRFAITNSTGYGEAVISGTAALPTRQWVHVAVTLSGSTGSLYVNGLLVGQNTDMAFSPFRLGSTDKNYIGKSQYPDPYLDGKIDDFCIYRGALSATEVAQLASPPAAPTSVVASADAAHVSVSWSAVSGATSYAVQRASTSGGAYTVVTTGLTSTTWTDTGLTPGATYYYIVTAFNGLAEGAASAAAGVTVPAYSALELWRQSHFGTTESSGDATDLADPDGDGSVNILEYALGTDPLGTASVAAPAVALVGDHLTVTFDRIADASLTYSVEASSDLATWNAIWTSTGTDNTAGTVTVTDSEAFSAHQNRFLRLQITY